MRIIRYHEYGDPDVLRVEKVDPPVPGSGQVRIEVEAIGVNFIDTRLRRNAVPLGGPAPLPGEPHGDVVGRVEALGPDVTDLRIGDRVAAWSVHAAYADMVLAEAARTMKIPDSIEAPVATALASTGQVAINVREVGRIAAGDVVLVHAAAGAIGHLLTQLARLRGAKRVIGTAGAPSPEKVEFIRRHGADVVVDYRRDDWPDRVREVTGGQGVDVVLDSVEGRVFKAGLDLLKPFGRLVYYGFADASEDLASVRMTDLFGIKYVVATAFDAWLAGAPEQAARARRELIEHVRGGRLSVAVHAVLPLEEAAEAHRIIESREQLGRVVLTP
jgi:NADPH:quinone reductase